LLNHLKILKIQGANRISPQALETFRTETENRIRQIARDAKVYAKHANRKTILADDILLVLKN
jgi:histone H3/H4